MLLGNGRANALCFIANYLYSVLTNKSAMQQAFSKLSNKVTELKNS